MRNLESQIPAAADDSRKSQLLHELIAASAGEETRRFVDTSPHPSSDAQGVDLVMLPRESSPVVRSTCNRNLCYSNRVARIHANEIPIQTHMGHPWIFIRLGIAALLMSLIRATVAGA